MDPNIDETLELQYYARLCGDELGEACNLLVQLHGYEPYLEPEFFSALKREIKGQLANFVRNTEVVNRKETEVRSWEELEWIG